MLELFVKKKADGVAQCLLKKGNVHSDAHGDILSHEGGLWQGRPTFLRLLLNQTCELWDDCLKSLDRFRILLVGRKRHRRSE